MFGVPKSELGSEAIQDYAKAIYSLERQDESGTVSTSALADHLGITPGSASAMVKRLAQRGLVTYEPYKGFSLTEEGTRMALSVIRRHRLLETFLHQELGMPWDRVHDEAEVLEHVLSSELEDLIAAKLGHPTHDPHGDPIPTRDLLIAETETVSLRDLEPGRRGTFVRISDSDPAMLRYLGERDIVPGTELQVIAHEPFGGPVVVRVAGVQHALGRLLATAMRVEVADEEAAT
jgi:DtxR family Mn-dependent transcriptional regulator